MCDRITTEEGAEEGKAEIDAEEGTVGGLVRAPKFYASVVLFILSAVWLWEAMTCGRCFVSVYVAPVIIIGNLAMAAWGAVANRGG